MFDFETTGDIKLPRDPLDAVIGQGDAVRRIRIAAKQNRHLLLVGPPGVGKSMLAKALAVHLPKPKQEIIVSHNPKNPERPFVDVRSGRDFKEKKAIERAARGKIKSPNSIPGFVAEKLGFKCVHCGVISNFEIETCPECSEYKFGATPRSPFSDLLSQVFDVNVSEYPNEEVHMTRVNNKGEEEVVIFQSMKGGKVRVIDNEALKSLNEMEKRKKSKVLIPIKRNNFVQATGASETELLGDVRHDPWGGSVEAGGVLPYQRVVPGAIHESHEGVLFIDELPQLGGLQHHILTAMQEKHFNISGMNATSSGASVKVERVPCDFVFVAACNINEVDNILPPLRSRILGSGYEILLDTTMPYTEENARKLAQFFAQEVCFDGKIPHGTPKAVDALVVEAKKRAMSIDNERNALTLRLRDLGGVIRHAGDLAIIEKSELITEKHIKEASVHSKSIEQQLVDKYGSVWEGRRRDNISDRIVSGEDKLRGYY